MGAKNSNTNFQEGKLLFEALQTFVAFGDVWMVNQF